MCITATIVLLPLAVTRLPSKIPDIEVIVSLLVLSLIARRCLSALFRARGRGRS